MSHALTESDPIVRRVASSWRSLSGGRTARDSARRTLLACSGGADSSALLIALSLAVPSGSLVVAHIVHDMRPQTQAHSDRDAVRELARCCGVGFVEAEINARQVGGNYEASARKLRYAALARLAREHSCPYIATAHHADDQLETVLMRLMRGAGPAGLGGIAARRAVDDQRPTVRLIRPMLAITRADSETICRAAAWVWREDATNRDTTRLRAAIRERVMPVLRELRPMGASRAVAAAHLCREAWEVVQEEADALVAGAAADSMGRKLSRAELRAAPPAVASEAIRKMLLAAAGPELQDRLPQRSARSVLRAIRDGSGERREFAWRGVRLVVHGPAVWIEQLDVDPRESAGS